MASKNKQAAKRGRTSSKRTASPQPGPDEAQDDREVADDVEDELDDDDDGDDDETLAALLSHEAKDLRSIIWAYACIDGRKG